MSTSPTERDLLLPPPYSDVHVNVDSHHSRPNHSYKQKTLRYIGVLHIVVGLIFFALGICFAIDLPAFFKTDHNNPPWPPTTRYPDFNPSSINARWWMVLSGGFLFIITGLFGVIAKRRSTCLIGFYMTASAVSALAAFGPLLIFSLSDMRNVSGAFDKDWTYTPAWTVLISMYVIMVSLAVLEGMLSLTSFILCALNVCHCCEKREMPAPMPVNAAPARPESRGPNAPPPEI
ncbi:uncharacterized protein LOC106179030 isoform X1 [Lingula anatina]|uniref:Uncharacterized protein LOC106179030 isoform X1 n=1 Tax=Lingula anatina TaxID=7574 RepID=A0A1S3K6B6_LINAN|nr:uncharacterized protein LOC106179030 isoform X1 [Lingula anatina]|eukprot:XP_013417974.1 uncharacterized protein LOC106179030 isoform X1 [Lingula anatina]